MSLDCSKLQEQSTGVINTREGMQHKQCDHEAECLKDSLYTFPDSVALGPRPLVPTEDVILKKVGHDIRFSFL